MYEKELGGYSMKEKTSYILGALTISAVVGITVYSIIEYKKLANQQEGAISVDQAQRELEDFENLTIEERYDSGDTDGLRENMLEIGIDEYENPQEFTEEDEVLKHDPNSQEALEQFIAMNLAEWAPGSETYDTLVYLFTFPFAPRTEGDELLRLGLINDRMDFFGEESKWNNRVTYADVILHFAREIMFNVDGSIGFWVDLLLENVGITQFTSSATVDYILKELNNHTYMNDDTGMYGLFGLDDDGIDEAYVTADKQVNTDITYEIQFNEFLKRI